MYRLVTDAGRRDIGDLLLEFDINVVPTKMSKEEIINYRDLFNDKGIKSPKNTLFLNGKLRRKMIDLCGKLSGRGFNSHSYFINRAEVRTIYPTD